MSPDIVSITLEAVQDLNTTLEWLWDLETIGITAHSPDRSEITPNKKLAWKKVEQSLMYYEERYEGAVPWKHEMPTFS